MQGDDHGTCSVRGITGWRHHPQSRDDSRARGGARRSLAALSMPILRKRSLTLLRPVIVIKLRPLRPGCFRFMVVAEAEHSGIIRAGARFVEAMATASVRKSSDHHIMRRGSLLS